MEGAAQSCRKPGSYPCPNAKVSRDSSEGRHVILPRPTTLPGKMGDGAHVSQVQRLKPRFLIPPPARIGFLINIRPAMFWEIWVEQPNPTCLQFASPRLR